MTKSLMLKTLCGPLGPGPIADGFNVLSPCFSSLVLDSIPIAIFLVHIWPQCRSIYRQHQVAPLENRSLSFWIQMVSCLCMATFPITVLLVHVIKVDPENIFSYIYPYELIAQLTQFAAWLSGVFIVCLANAYGVPLNYGIRLWWITNFIVSCKDVESQAARMHDGKDLSSLLIVSCGRLCISAILALDSLLSFRWKCHRVFRVLSPRTYFHNLSHPWLQTQQEFTPKTGSLSDSQIWHTWLASGMASTAVDHLNPKIRRINSLNLLSWFEGIDPSGEPYARFSVEVDPADVSESAWIFSSSLSDWIWLGDAIKKAYASENQPLNLPDFPSLIADCSVDKIALILQLYFHRAVECPDIQAELVSFLGSQTRLQLTERQNSAKRAAFNGTCVINDVEEIQDSKNSSIVTENKSSNVRQMINEVISTPLAAILERKIRSPSEEVMFFQSKDSHEKIISASVFQCNVDQRPIIYDIHVSTGVSEWSVRRRFNQFLELHSKLQQIFDDRLLPALPSKSLVDSSHDPRFLESRRRQLDIFIQSIVNVNYFECRPLYDFLSDNGSEQCESTTLDSICKVNHVHTYGIAISKWQSSDSTDYRFSPVYYFEVYEYFSLNQYLKWSIRTTLSDFKELHASLRHRFPHDTVPDLPKWSSVQTLRDPAFADTLAMQLELFLQKLINCSPLSCPEINAFLELDNGNRHISTGMHSVALP